MPRPNKQAERRPKYDVAQPPVPQRWLLAVFEPVTLFSLRMTHATSKGGKTLVVPSPYAIKMALLDACFRRWSGSEAAQRARETFDIIKSRAVRMLPPEHCVVQNTFIKVLDHSRDVSAGPFRNTIVYREFVFYRGELTVALSADNLADSDVAMLNSLFLHITSLGKRGSFLQFLRAELFEGTLPKGFTAALNNGILDNLSSFGMIQELDDFGGALSAAQDGFERISTYGSGDVRLGTHRVLVPTALPYHRHAASRSFTWLRRTG